VLSDDLTCGLGEVRVLQPAGTFRLTPASMVTIDTIANHQRLLAGVGIDYGSGTGVQTILAARIPAVTTVTGLEISQPDIDAARRNAVRNGVAAKTSFVLSDAFSPFSEQDKLALGGLEGNCGFIIANPNNSEGDDGFGQRRVVLREGSRYLKQGGVVFLSISYQYGNERIENLTSEAPGFVNDGVLAATDWVPFDLSRADLLRVLRLYVAEEARGGLEYTFRYPSREEGRMNARAAMSHYEATGESPLSKWQTYMFRFGT
jgi:SAM-dependent methyltransferase